MGYKLGYHILVFPHYAGINYSLIINSVITITRFYCIHNVYNYIYTVYALIFAFICGIRGLEAIRESLDRHVKIYIGLLCNINGKT